MQGHEYPFCPLCMGVRDEVTNLLEMGSTIKSVQVLEGGGFSVQRIERPEEWLEGAEEVGRALCYGCKRLVISCGKADKRAKLLGLMPGIVKENCQRLNTYESTLPSTVPSSGGIAASIPIVQ